MRKMDKFIEISDPRNLLKRLIEKNEVDYKKKLGSSNKSKADMIKDFAAMANYGGGVLIFGVDNDEETLIGINDDELDIYDPARLQGILQKFLSPVPEIVHEKVNYKGMNFPFVRIASIEKTPIICCKVFHNEENKLLLQSGDIFTRQNTQTIKVHLESQVRSILEMAMNFEIAQRLKVIQPIFEKNSLKKIDPVSHIESLGRSQAKKHSYITSNKPVREILLIPKENATIYEENLLLNACLLQSRLHGHIYPYYFSLHKQEGFSENGYIVFSKVASSKYTQRTFLRQERPSGELYCISTLFEDEVFNENTSQEAKKLKTQ